MSLKFQETKLKGCYLIDLKKNEDQRGFLTRMFCQKSLKNLLNGKYIRQINRTYTKKEGVVRGLHFQNFPSSEIKIISCIRGEVWDVAVDLRKESPTFLDYYAVILSENNSQSLFIPEGFAHGFQTLTSNCEMLYFHTEYYNVNAEATLNSLDPLLSIKWPKIISERSARDSSSPMLNKNFLGIEV
jgi:dTDP-4-dehydrorhamnose 3,5-epimerase